MYTLLFLLVFLSLLLDKKATKNKEQHIKTNKKQMNTFFLLILKWKATALQIMKMAQSIVMKNGTLIANLFLHGGKWKHCWFKLFSSYIHFKNEECDNKYRKCVMHYCVYWSSSTCNAQAPLQNISVNWHIIFSYPIKRDSWELSNGVFITT